MHTLPITIQQSLTHPRKILVEIDADRLARLAFVCGLVIATITPTA